MVHRHALHPRYPLQHPHLAVRGNTCLTRKTGAIKHQDLSCSTKTYPAKHIQNLSPRFTQQRRAHCTTYRNAKILMHRHKCTTQTLPQKHSIIPQSTICPTIHISSHDGETQLMSRDSSCNAEPCPNIYLFSHDTVIQTFFTITRYNAKSAHNSETQTREYNITPGPTDSPRIA